MKIIIVVPARKNSTRLPNKIMSDISGEPMLKRVLDNCRLLNKNISLAVCTDSIEVDNYISSLGYMSFISSESCSSGTDRIASKIRDILSYLWNKDLRHLDNNELIRYAKDSFIINVQADQPFLDIKIIYQLIENFKLLRFKKGVITPIYKLTSDKITDPSIVKVVISNNSRALYFSRAVIPFVRDYPYEKWCDYNQFWGHVGIYGYTGDILLDWKTLEKSELESVEKLEQLRLLENGINVFTFETFSNVLSVDTLEDLRLANRLFNIDDME